MHYPNSVNIIKTTDLPGQVRSSKHEQFVIPCYLFLHNLISMTEKPTRNTTTHNLGLLSSNIFYQKERPSIISSEVFKI